MFTCYLFSLTLSSFLSSLVSPYPLPLHLPPSSPLTSPNRLDVGMAHLLPLLGDISTFIYFLCLELFLLLSAFAVYPIFMVGHVMLIVCILFSSSVLLQPVVGVVPQKSTVFASRPPVCRTVYCSCDSVQCARILDCVCPPPHSL